MNLGLYRRLIAGETLTYLPSRALWKLSGPDRFRYLNGQITNDVAHLKEGDVRYAAVCTAKGRMEGDLYIAAQGDAFYLDADLSLRESLGARLDKYLIADDALLEDITEEWKLSHVFGDASLDVGPGFWIKNSRYGVPGHDVWTKSSVPYTSGDSVDSDVIETVRLENGQPIWDRELTTQTLPPEGGPEMLAAISYTKGCYVGQETIARLKSVGHVNRTLVFLRSDSADYPAPGAKLVQGEKEVGTVTSAGFSPRQEKGIALAYVHRDSAPEGTSLRAVELTLTVSLPVNTVSQ